MIEDPVCKIKVDEKSQLRLNLKERIIISAVQHVKGSSRRILKSLSVRNAAKNADLKKLLIRLNTKEKFTVFVQRNTKKNINLNISERLSIEAGLRKGRFES